MTVRAAPWKEIFHAAESTGGVEYYLIEQEGRDYPEFDPGLSCLRAGNHMHLDRRQAYIGADMRTVRERLYRHMARVSL